MGNSESKQPIVFLEVHVVESTRELIELSVTMDGERWRADLRGETFLIREIFADAIEAEYSLRERFRRGFRKHLCDDRCRLHESRAAALVRSA